MKKNILFIGPLGDGGGPSIKNSLLIKYLNGHGNISTWNTFDRSLKARIGSIFKILFSKEHYMICAVSYRGRNLLYPFLYLRNKFAGTHFSCVVIGGNPVEKINNPLCVKSMKHADLVTAETPGIVGQLKQAYHLDNLYCMPNYKEITPEELSLSGHHTFDKPALRFVFLSGMRMSKGVGTLIKAFQKALAGGLKAELDFYGPLIESEMPADILDSIEAAEHIRYLGAVDNSLVLDSLRKYDVFVFPSEYDGEGFPAVLVEAMLAGLPVIASDKNYNPEIIKDGENGFIFREKNVDDLCRCLMACNEHRDKLETFSSHNIQTAASYDAAYQINLYREKLVAKGWPLADKKPGRRKKNRKKIRVALVIPYFSQGGAQQMVSRLVSHLDLRKVSVKVFVLYGDPLHNEMEKAILEHGVDICYIGKKKGFSLKAIRQLNLELNRFRPTIVHTHVSACVYSAFYVLTHKVLMLHTIHNIPEKELIKPKQMIMRAMYKLGKAVPVAISDEIRKRMSGYYHLYKNIELVYNPVDVNRFSNCKKEKHDGFVLVTAGRISAQKNHRMMIQAFEIIHKSIPDARLLILGDGELREEIQNLVTSLNLQDAVTFTGNVDNVQDYFAQADLFVLSSDYEGLPLVILEAMAAGLPVVSTDVGGIKDIVTDNGLLTHPADPEELARTVIRIHEDPDLMHQMQIAASHNVLRFDSDIIADEYLKLYEKYSK